MARRAFATDEQHGRNELTFIYDQLGGDVYVEMVGVHDGTRVATTVRLSKMRFVALVRDVGVL